ncbi:hypothetical protein EAH87_15055 [Sphingomonas koreensis]|nr:hypothetical protein EAH87_15055 [Sphingomonas koreensis]
MRGLVLRVEPDHSSAALYARAGRRRVRQPIAAAAMIEFEIDSFGLCSEVNLHSIDTRMAGEFALILSVQRKLSELENAGGRLVTFGGMNDLSLIRLGALRHRHFLSGGAAAWLRDIRDAHDDVFEMIDPSGKAGANVADFLPGLCGRRPAADKLAGPRRRERVMAEFEAIQVLTAYLYLLSEQHQSVRPLAVGVVAISDMIWARSRTLPHLFSMLDTELFETFAPVPF